MMIVERDARENVTTVTPCHICVVDDDASIREALKSLMRSAGYQVETFGSAEEFLVSGDLKDTACLILDVHLPGMSGFELQNRLNSERLAIPVIFLTAQPSKRGTKPSY
jgi:FixJ family two-component response regulator